MNKPHSTPANFLPSHGGIPGSASQVYVPSMVQAQPAPTRQPLARAASVLMVYEGGKYNLNTEASALLPGGLCFVAPEPVRAGRVPNLWQIEAGGCYHPVPVDKGKPSGSRQGRASLCPPPGRYVFSPIVGTSTRFLLVPA